MVRFRSSLVYESLPNRDGGELKSIQLFVAQGCWHFSTCPLSENSMKIRAAEWKAQPSAASAWKSAAFAARNQCQSPSHTRGNSILGCVTASV